MNDDISQSVSQGGYGAYDEENRRIQEISNELQRLCRLYETEPRDGKGYGSRFEIEQRVVEDAIYKVNNLLNSGGICKLFDKILLHNLIFPNTAYRIHGFTGYDRRTIMPVLEQERICEAQPATQIMIDTYMSAIGFTKENIEGRFTNGDYVVWDLVPRNVLIDADGDMYVVDAEIKRV